MADRKTYELRLTFDELGELVSQQKKANGPLVSTGLQRRIAKKWRDVARRDRPAYFKRWMRRFYGPSNG